MTKELGVSQAAVELLFEEVRLAGLPVAEVRQRQGALRFGFADWGKFLDSCDLIAELAGGNSQFADLVEATILRAAPHLPQLASAFASPLSFANFAVRSMDASAFVGVRYELTTHDPRTLVLRLRAVDGWELRPALVAGVAGAMRQITVPFGRGATKSEIMGDPASGVILLTTPLRSDSIRRSCAPQADAGMVALLGQQRRAFEHSHQLALLLAQDPARTDGGPISRPAEERALLARRKWALTEREVDVLACVCSGLTNKEIAACLGRAESTVELYLTQILKKVGVGNRAALVARYYRL